VREMKEKVSVREIMTTLLQFDIYVSLAEATSGEKTSKKCPGIAIIKNQLFKVKYPSIFLSISYNYI
jgi:hypothetical protein